MNKNLIPIKFKNIEKRQTFYFQIDDFQKYPYEMWEEGEIYCCWLPYPEPLKEKYYPKQNQIVYKENEK